MFGGDGALCHSCGYDLTAHESGTCPECGTVRAPTVGEPTRGLPVSVDGGKAEG